LCALRFCFRAADPIGFPGGKTANLFRGQFGKVLKRAAPEAYSRIFAPAASPAKGPSGLHDSPRPFVLRTSHLEGVRVAPGECFDLGLNVFDTCAVPVFEQTLRRMGQEWLKADLESIQGRDLLTLSLTAPPEPRRRIRVRFVTPTELKGADRPEFGVLLARIRDRVSTLRALYGAGPLEIDFKAMGARARSVRMTRCELERVESERFSRSTGQRHTLGGFVGLAEYEGDLREFIPLLEIARWTGVGRQTVWGKGEIACEAF